jgi:hypothetical protein
MHRKQCEQMRTLEDVHDTSDVAVIALCSSDALSKASHTEYIRWPFHAQLVGFDQVLGRCPRHDLGCVLLSQLTLQLKLGHGAVRGCAPRDLQVVLLQELADPSKACIASINCLRNFQQHPNFNTHLEFNMGARTFRTASNVPNMRIHACGSGSTCETYATQKTFEKHGDRIKKAQSRGWHFPKPL